MRLSESMQDFVNSAKLLYLLYKLLLQKGSEQVYNVVDEHRCVEQVQLKQHVL